MRADPTLPETGLRAAGILVLGLVLVFAWADRMLITVAIEAIRHDFALSDLEMGLLLGPAFAVFYAAFALPIARWADIGHRPRIITLALSMWSVMTLLSGLAVNFFQLFVVRVGVGIGEAGAHPPVHSLVADYCPPDKRGRAATVLNFCIVIGAFIGLSLGGFLVAQFGWRWAFAGFGIAGILASGLVLWTLEEPRRSTRVPAVRELFDTEGRAAIRNLFKKRSFVAMLVSMSIYSIIDLGASSFTVPFLIRSHGLDESSAGTIYGSAVLAGSVAGTVIAGFLVDNLARRHVKWLLLLPAICFVINAPIRIIAFQANDTLLFAVSYFMMVAMMCINNPATYAATYGIAGTGRIATATAVVGLATNVIGLGLGPVFVGFLSDLLEPRFGVESLRQALTGSAAITMIAGFCLMLGGRYVASDFEGPRPDAGSAPESPRRSRD